MSWKETDLEEIKAEIIKDGDMWDTMSLEPSLPLLEKITKIHYKVIGDEMLTVIQIQGEKEIIRKITTQRKCDPMHFCSWKPIGNIRLPHIIEQYASIIENPEDGKIELLYAYIGDVITRHDPSARGIVRETKTKTKTKNQLKQKGTRSRSPSRKARGLTKRSPKRRSARRSTRRSISTRR